MERALAQWESWDPANQWAEYVRFLNGVNREITAAASHHDVPLAPKLADRLSKCLLPCQKSSVHRRALETYDTVFEILSADKLAEQLELWLPGLLPVMSYASTAIRPMLINVFTKYFLPLPTLRPALKPLLLSFLPGIDDESSESFDAVLKLLDDLKLKINDDAHFWECFLLVVIEAPERRLGALAWASRRLPTFNTGTASEAKEGRDDGENRKHKRTLSYEAHMAVTPENGGLLIRAFCEGLRDSDPLVQRGWLDLLEKNVHLSSEILQRESARKDLQLLMQRACATTLRRDMSLNRRLWRWLVGTEEIEAASHEGREHLSEAEYFAAYGLEALVAGMLEIVERDEPNPTERSKPYRICLSMLDRWEVGTPVIPRLFLPIIKSVRRYKDSGPTDAQYQEVINSAGSLFDNVEDYHIWSDCLKLVTEGDLDLFLFVLQTFRVTEEEMIVTHLPLMLLALIANYTASEQWLECANVLVDAIPERAYLPTEHAEDENELNDDEIVSKIHDYYAAAVAAAASPDAQPVRPPFATATLSLMLVDRLSALTGRELGAQATVPAQQTLVDRLCGVLASVIGKVPMQAQQRDPALVAALVGYVDNSACSVAPVGLVELFTTISKTLTVPESNAFVFGVTAKLTRLLANPVGMYQVEIVRLLWDMQGTLDDERVQSALATAFVEEAATSALKARAFSLLWTHSVDRVNVDVIMERTVFLFLDWLSEPDGSEERLAVKQWLTRVVSSGAGNRLLDIALRPFIRAGDTERFSHFLSILNSLVKFDTRFKSQLQEMPTAVTLPHDEPYVEIIKRKVVEFLQAHVGTPVKEDPLDSTCPKSVFRAVASCLDFLGNVMTDNEFDVLELARICMSLLDKATPHEMPTEVALLSQLSRAINVLAHPPKKQRSHAKNNSSASEKATGAGKDDAKRAILSRLVTSLVDGITRSQSQYTTEAWVNLLTDCLPLFEDMLLLNAFTINDCLCKKIAVVFESARTILESSRDADLADATDVQMLFSLVNGLEKFLVALHGRWQHQESEATNSKAMNDPSFLGSVISGVFSVESGVHRSSTANDRLTVLICFRDAVDVCYSVWKCAERVCRVGPGQEVQLDSRVTIASRMKARTRKLLTRLYRLASLETLEFILAQDTSTAQTVKIIRVLDGSRPKVTLPWIFKAISNRLNAGNSAATQSERASLTKELGEIRVAEFLVDYVRALESDAVEEVCPEILAFVREVHSNHAHFRPVLPAVIRVISVVAVKIDVANMGEQRKLRREMGDLFVKIVTYSVSARAHGGASAQPDPALVSVARGLIDAEKRPHDDSASVGSRDVDQTSQDNEVSSPGSPTIPRESTPSGTSASASTLSQEDVANALLDALPGIRSILSDVEKVLSLLSVIINGLIAPFLTKGKTLKVLPNYLVRVLVAVTHVSNSEKAWKTLVGDWFLDPRFLTMPKATAVEWMPLIRKWSTLDRDRVSEFVQRMPSFNANSAVLFNWSDQEYQFQRLNLDRLAYMVLCNPETLVSLNFIKLVDDLETMTGNKPNLPHIFTCLRAIAIAGSMTPDTTDKASALSLAAARTSSIAPVWPFVNSQLTAIFKDMLNNELRDLATLLSACKLLDTLIVLDSEGFQP